MDEAELWDIKDRAPVVYPLPGGTRDIKKTDLIMYQIALDAMPVNMQARYLRVIQTADVIFAMLRRNKAINNG